MPKNEPPNPGHGPKKGEDRWDPTRHSMRNPDRADPRDTQAISISRGLHEDLSATLTFFSTLSSRLVHKLEAQLPQLKAELHKSNHAEADDAKHVIDPNVSWSVIQDSTLLANALSVVETLQLLLHTNSVVRDPSKRKLGEVPIQFLIKKLEDLATTTDAGDYGRHTPVNELEHVDASLKGIFARHKDELAKLMPGVR